ncbi:putative protein C6orf64, partial [Ophiophagus hannah]
MYIVIESGQRSENHEAQIIASPLPWWIHYVLKNELLLKFLLWLVLLGLFVELEFGLPYFVLSMFYWIYVGTRGPRERQPGEKSAYSVFNPGCEAIQGTLTAEHYDEHSKIWTVDKPNGWVYSLSTEAIHAEMFRHGLVEFSSISHVPSSVQKRIGMQVTYLSYLM